MEKTYIIANWKSNKSQSESQIWMESFKNFSSIEGKEIIVCPPFTLLATLAWFIKTNTLPIELGSQNISQFLAGSYTGEVYADQVKEYASYTIIGHSERRNLFHETDEDVAKKVVNALEANMNIIFCVQDGSTPIPEGIKLVAYEPISAIGSGNPDTPENAEAVVVEIKQKNPHVTDVLYGGSVTGENVRSFTSKPSISGVLVGKASLDAHSFQSIIQNA